MRSYQRKFLRAPCKLEAIVTDGEVVFKAQTLNLSEGGMLLKNISYIPKREKLYIYLCLPSFPRFKNYDIDQYRSFNQENFPKRVIAVKGRIVRKKESDFDLSDLFEIQGGIEFLDLSPFDQKSINQYVDICTSNLVHLQTLIDTVTSDKLNLEKTRILSSFLGYPEDQKLSLLRKIVETDYQSLQWS